MAEIIFNDGRNLAAGKDAPKIEFPCKYPIKVVGRSHSSFVQEVMAVVARHAPDLVAEDLATKESSEQRFCSVTCNILATGEPQLVAIYEDLKKLDGVKIVL